MEQKKEFSYRFFNNDNKTERSFISAEMVRPNDVLQAIETQYHYLCQKENTSVANGGSYYFTGENRSGYHIAPGPITTLTTEHVIEKLLKEHPSIRVLDVGTGAGSVLAHLKKTYGERIEVSGITAPFKNIYPSVKKNILIENAEHLIDHFHNKKFHFIMSSCTVMHFIDPLHFLSQAYECLEDGGYFLTNEFYINGITNGEKNALLNWLENNYRAKLSGTMPRGRNFNEKNDNYVNYLLIKKEKNKSLKFPMNYLSYDNEQGVVHYSSTLAPIDSQENSSEKLERAFSLTLFKLIKLKEQNDLNYNIWNVLDLPKKLLTAYLSLPKTQLEQRYFAILNNKEHVGVIRLTRNTEQLIQVLQSKNSCESKYLVLELHLIEWALEEIADRNLRVFLRQEKIICTEIEMDDFQVYQFINGIDQSVISSFLSYLNTQKIQDLLNNNEKKILEQYTHEDSVSIPKMI
ncbi:methyltransferase domain-containing protein [Legionella sp. WA2022007384]